MSTNPVVQQKDKSLEEQKLAIESAKLALEQKKFELAQRTHFFDFGPKFVLSVVVALIALAALVISSTQTSERLIVETGHKRDEIRLKEADLFLKKSDSERNRDAVKSGFLLNHLALVTSPTQESRQQLVALAKAVFDSKETQDVISKAEQIRISVQQQPSPSSTAQPQTLAGFKAIGRQFANVGNFEQAALNFEIATRLNASDVEAWNFKAYAEMRINRGDAAFNSISNAINLRPTDFKIYSLVVINATKILCTLGRNEDALSYINQNAAYSPGLITVAGADLELKKRCGFSFTK